MQIRFHCPTAGCVALIEYEPLEGCGPTMRCPRCGVEHAIHVSDALRREQTVEQCVICGGTEMFVRKDFPQRLGLAVVITFGIAAIYFFRTSVLTAWAILAGAVVVDLLVYAFIGKVTTCYACRAEYRGGRLNPRHEGFDLATSEKY
ncbi:MAG: hypothetical protein HY763_04870 [Planctomycetes bacterium]|nr:hypothetical protein [Planctomycetota bacterium]